MLRKPMCSSVFLNNNSVKQAGFHRDVFGPIVQCSIDRVRIESVELFRRRPGLTPMMRQNNSVQGSGETALMLIDKAVRRTMDMS